MGRNITSSACCYNVVTLSDLVGKPIEFRRYGNLAPQIGARWDCPSCNNSYFVIWRRYDRFWEGYPEDSQKSQLLDSSGQQYYNDYKGKFVAVDDRGKLEDTGAFTLALLCYDQLYEGEKWQICKEADDAQWVQYFSDYLI